MTFRQTKDVYHLDDRVTRPAITCKEYIDKYLGHLADLQLQSIMENMYYDPSSYLCPDFESSPLKGSQYGYRQGLRVDVKLTEAKQ